MITDLKNLFHFRLRSRKSFTTGFTTIELIIIFIAIGAVSSVMIISGINLIISSKAASVVANMQHIRTAAMIYDRHVKPVDTPTLQDIRSYLTSDSNFDAIVDYFGIESDKDEWYVKYNFGDLGNREKQNIAKKLSERAESTGLLAECNEDSLAYKGNKFMVYMKIR